MVRPHCEKHHTCDSGLADRCLHIGFVTNTESTTIFKSFCVQSACLHYHCVHPVAFTIMYHTAAIRLLQQSMTISNVTRNRDQVLPRAPMFECIDSTSILISFCVHSASLHYHCLHPAALTNIHDTTA